MFHLTISLILKLQNKAKIEENRINRNFNENSFKRVRNKDFTQNQVLLWGKKG